MNNIGKLVELLELLANSRATRGGDNTNTSQLSIKSLSHDRDVNYLSILLIHKGFNAKHTNCVHKLANDCCTIYSYILNEQDYNYHCESLSKNFHNDWLVKLLETPPMQSFLNLPFRQILFFLLNKKGSNGYQLNLVYLLRFIDELKSSYSTLCCEDKQTLNSAILKLSTPNIQPIDENATVLLHWALTEGVKQIVSEGLSSTGFKPGVFLDLLQKECSKKPVGLADKVHKFGLLTFFYTLDKLLSDRVSESGTEKYVFTSNFESHEFYINNSLKLNSWLSKNRQNFAKLSLLVDNPAECWRNLNIRMFFDLSTRFQTKSCGSSSNTPSFSETLLSLNTKNWYSNISMLTLCAKQLEDTALLQGIGALTGLDWVICDYPSTVYMLSNLRGQYQKTYEMLKNTKRFEDQQSLVEFLNASLELSLLSKHEDFIQQLKSVKLKQLYTSYLSVRKEQEVQELSNVENVKNWLKDWTNLEETSSNTHALDVRLMNSYIDAFDLESMSSYMDLIIPTCLSIITKTPDKEERTELIKLSEALISQDFIAQSLFSPCFINRNIKPYKLLLDLLKDQNNPIIHDELVRIHSKDLHWNHLLYRNLCDLHLIEYLNEKQNVKQLDLIKFRAAKFNQKCENYSLATNLVKELEIGAQSKEIRLLSSMLVIKSGVSNEKKVTLLSGIIEKLKSLDGFEGTTRQDLIFKAFHQACKLEKPESEAIIQQLFHLISGDHQASELNLDVEHISLSSWKIALRSTSSLTETKTMLLLSKLSNNQLLEHTNTQENLLNTTLCIDLELLELLCRSDVEKHKTYSLECSTRILKHIIIGSNKLDEANLEKFTSMKYRENTLPAWTRLKNNLISLIIDEGNLAEDWKKAIIDLVKFMGHKNPTLLIYNIIVNRLDLQDEMVYLNDKTSNNPSAFLFTAHNDCSSSMETAGGDIDTKVKKFNECHRKLSLWNELFDFIQTSDSQVDKNWRYVGAETERFLKEIRKISYLCGEYLRHLTIKIPKRLHNFMDYFNKSLDTKTGTASKQLLEECDKRLKSTCDQAIKQIRILINYDKRVGKENLTKYELSFFETFIKHLFELEYRLNILAGKKPLSPVDLEKLVKSITELLAVCRDTISQYNSNNRQRLYMELISPMLSRLEPSSIPIPDCCDSLLVGDNSKPMVTIHKISQTVNLITSKTSPKKLKLTGSDGISRSFLLKAHEDLRLDQLIMDLFGLINVQFSAKRGTKKNYRLRRYSVTPVSSRSGLIQWIEAPSLCSTYRAWLHGPNGKKIVAELYSKSCELVCRKEFGENCSKESNLDHKNCQVPPSFNCSDLFYQLLWTKTIGIKSTKLTTERPYHGNIIKYRAEFDSSIFEHVVEELINRMPSDFVANQLWYKSSNSHSYYLKTQEFIHSCAAISMVGYIIGLGDRHPENILLDYNTGETIHIDYNICFEAGRYLSIPEQVPFRLTQNLIHAFGFAGLEGGFTMSCREVLNILKRCKSTLLHLLDPVNLKFMIGEPATKLGGEHPQKFSSSFKLLSSSHQLLPTTSLNQSKSPNAPLSRINLEMDMCSQESFDMNMSEAAAVVAAGGPNLADMIILNHSAPSKPQEQTNKNLSLSRKLVQRTSVITPSFDLQHNIKTPAKIPSEKALDIYERIKDKLSGSDESLRVHQYKGSPAVDKRQLSTKNSNYSKVDGATTSVDPSEVDEDNQASDLISLDDPQTTEFQVNALIIQATSIKNKAAMFEGWLPWV